MRSSPRIRSAPQRGLFEFTSRMRAARPVGFRPPGRERHRQKRRKPSRCYRRTVAGWTSVTAVRHVPVHLARTAMVQRCAGHQRTRLPRSRHFATTNCCRRSSFSATSEARERNSPTRNRHRTPSIIALSYQSELRSSGVCAPKPGDAGKHARMEKVASTAVPRGRRRGEFRGRRGWFQAAGSRSSIAGADSWPDR